MEEKPFSANVIVHQDEGITLVNICDRELVGRTIQGGEVDLHISEEFYGGELIGEEEALRLLQTSTYISLAGERIVRLALEAGMASRLAVKRVGSTPFLMIYKFHRW
jgi:hypothetical protein